MLKMARDRLGPLRQALVIDDQNRIKKAVVIGRHSLVLRKGISVSLQDVQMAPKTGAPSISKPPEAANITPTELACLVQQYLMENRFPKALQEFQSEAGHLLSTVRTVSFSPLSCSACFCASDFSSCCTPTLMLGAAISDVCSKPLGYARIESFLLGFPYLWWRNRFMSLTNGPLCRPAKVHEELDGDSQRVHQPQEF